MSWQSPADCSIFVIVEENSRSLQWSTPLSLLVVSLAASVGSCRANLSRISSATDHTVTGVLRAGHSGSLCALFNYSQRLVVDIPTTGCIHLKILLVLTVVVTFHYRKEKY